MVRSLDFQSRNASSILVGSTNFRVCSIMIVREKHFLFREKTRKFYKIYSSFGRSSTKATHILELEPCRYVKMSEEEFNLLTNTGKLILASVGIADS